MRMLVASAREDSTGPKTKTGLTVTNSKPYFLDRSHPAFSARVCIPMIAYNAEFQHHKPATPATCIAGIQRPCALHCIFSTYALEIPVHNHSNINSRRSQDFTCTCCIAVTSASSPCILKNIYLSGHTQGCMSMHSMLRCQSAHWSHPESAPSSQEFTLLRL